MPLKILTAFNLFYQGFYQASRSKFEVKVMQIFITKRECKVVHENKVRIKSKWKFFSKEKILIEIISAINCASIYFHNFEKLLFWNEIFETIYEFIIN